MFGVAGGALPSAVALGSFGLRIITDRKIYTCQFDRESTIKVGPIRGDLRAPNLESSQWAELPNFQRCEKEKISMQNQCSTLFCTTIW